MMLRNLLLTTDDRRPTTLLIAALLLQGAALGQETPPPTPNAEASAGSTPTKTKKFADLTIRYRFSERYTTDDTKAGPGVVGSYRVAIRDSIRDSVESSQAAPKKTESTRQAIYAERPVEMGGIGSVVSTVRTVEKYLARPEDAAKTMGSRPLDGVTVLLRPKLGELPLILSLSDGRTLTEYEFDVLARQVFVPHLPALLPTGTVRLGDNWRIPRRGAQALLGDPTIQGDTLVGKLAEISKEIDGPRMVATIAISGKVAGAIGETTVNAEALFTFQGTMPAKNTSKKPTFPPNPAEDMMEARGAITELRLARITSGPLPGKDRLRFQSNRELTLHRQLGVVAGGVVLPTFEKAPETTEANAWLSHVDASGRYSLQHPQEMLPPGPTQPVKPGTTLLVRGRREGMDMFQVEFFPKTLAVEDLKKELAEKYSLMKMELLKGDEAWLPDADWPGMRVHRIDAALKITDPKAVGAGGSTRIHFDGYLIQFAQSASILAIATSSRESVGPFREEVEKILKTIKLDPPRPASG
jgi:hypothetical protein